MAEAPVAPECRQSPPAHGYPVQSLTHHLCETHRAQCLAGQLCPQWERQSPARGGEVRVGMKRSKQVTPKREELGPGHPYQRLPSACSGPRAGGPRCREGPRLGGGAQPPAAPGSSIPACQAQALASPFKLLPPASVLRAGEGPRLYVSVLHPPRSWFWCGQSSPSGHKAAAFMQGPQAGTACTWAGEGAEEETRSTPR